MNIAKWKEKDKINFKKRLKDFCVGILKEKIDEAMKSMERAQEASNAEEKSSMGDKYEISKVMGQIDSDRAGLQLFEGKKQLALLKSVNVEGIYSEGKAGAFLVCSEANYFIASSLGGKIMDGEKVIIISTQAPVALQLLGKEEGDTFIVNGKTLVIKHIF